MKSSIQNEKKIMYKHKSLIAKNCLALKKNRSCINNYVKIQLLFTVVRL